MSVLRDAIKAADPTPDKTKATTLALNLLFELAEARAAQFSTELGASLRTAGTPENPTIPITSVLATHVDTRAYVSSDAGHIADVATDVIGSMLSGTAGDIISGVGRLAASALEAILGSGSGAERKFSSYFVMTEGLSIVRLDIMGWKRDIEVVGITQYIESAMSFLLCKSSVNVDKISFNTFLSAYNVVLESSDLTHDQLLKYIAEAKEVYNLLRTTPEPANASQISLVGTWKDLDTGKSLELTPRRGKRHRSG